MEKVKESHPHYSGLYDDNKEEIKEGDILRITDKTIDYDKPDIFYVKVCLGNPSGWYVWKWYLEPIGEDTRKQLDILAWVETEDGMTECVIDNNYKSEVAK